MSAISGSSTCPTAAPMACTGPSSRAIAKIEKALEEQYASDTGFDQFEVVDSSMTGSAAEQAMASLPKPVQDDYSALNDDDGAGVTAAKMTFGCKPVYVVACDSDAGLSMDVFSACGNELAKARSNDNTGSGPITWTWSR